MGRAKTGQLSNLKGGLAEDLVADAYRRSGFDILARRWKNRGGEIDIVAGHNSKLYFIEVKSSKTFESALAQITPQQQKRIHDCSLSYMADISDYLDRECRFDAALVDGTGRVKVLPGALLSA